MKAVGQKQMLLLSIARNDPIEAAKLFWIETAWGRLNVRSVDRQDEGMGVGAPDGSSVRNSELRGLERDETELGRGSRRAVQGRTV